VGALVLVLVLIVMYGAGGGGKSGVSSADVRMSGCVLLLSVTVRRVSAISNRRRLGARRLEAWTAAAMTITRVLAVVRAKVALDVKAQAASEVAAMAAVAKSKTRAALAVLAILVALLPKPGAGGSRGRWIVCARSRGGELDI